jgi:hypothetical protein
MRKMPRASHGPRGDRGALNGTAPAPDDVATGPAGCREQLTTTARAVSHD